MREVDFLPAWYPRAQRRKRMLHLQGYATGLMIFVLGMWVLLSQRDLSVARAAYANASTRLIQSKHEVQQLDEQLQLKQKLEVQKQIVSKLGLPIEMSRMIAAIDHAMPKEMSLVDLSIDTDETKANVPAAAVSANAPKQEAPLNRQLRVKLHAITPSDVDLANLLAALANVPFFESIQLGKVVDKSDGGYVMRDFELTFAMNLNRAVGE